MKTVHSLLALWLACLSTGQALANEKACTSLKEFFQKKQTADEQLKTAFVELEGQIKADAKCAKNLLGRIYFEGVNAPRDHERAHAIFYDLADKGYPPAQFNLAFVLARKPNVEPEAILALLQGIVLNYTGTSEYGYLALKARDLGREYLQQASQATREKLTAPFETIVREATTSAAVKIRQATIERIQTENMIVGILTIGTYASMAASRAAAIGSAQAASRASAAAAAQTRFITIQPRFYSVYPAGGNFLYMIPHP